MAITASTNVSISQLAQSPLRGQPTARQQFFGIEETATGYTLTSLKTGAVYHLSEVSAETLAEVYASDATTH